MWRMIEKRQAPVHWLELGQRDSDFFYSVRRQPGTDIHIVSDVCRPLDYRSVAANDYKLHARVREPLEHQMKLCIISLTCSPQFQRQL